MIRHIVSSVSVVAALTLVPAPGAMAQKANPCAAKSANPCAAKNPCAGGAAAVPAVARMVKAQVVTVQRESLTLKTATGPLTLSLDQRTQVREGPVRKQFAAVKAGQDVTVSYVEKAGARRAAYVYIAQAGAANPCAAKNPCAPKR